MNINYKDKSYYQAGAHNCMTEDFIMALPK